jgi:hypothetical protein
MQQQSRCAAEAIRLITMVVAASCLGFAAVGAAPQVGTTFPPRERVDVPDTTDIVVTFLEEIDTSSVTPASFRVFGRWSGPAAGAFHFDSTAVRFTPAAPFFAGERVTVTLSTAIVDTLGAPMANGYAWCFSIRTEAATLELTYAGRITCRQEGEVGVQPYGAYAGDLDNDGWTDLLVPCEMTNDARVFLNDGAGGYSTFVADSLPGGSAPSPSEGSDFDMDGEIDIVIGNGLNDQISILFSDGTGGFASKVSYTAGSFVRGVGVVDLNGDGWDDIVTANRQADNLSIFLNNGDGTFAPAVAKESGGNGEYAIAVGDADNDGLLDVFCGAFSSPYAVIVLLSDGTGDLIPQPYVPAGGRPWQMTAGDFNGDGNVDVATSNAWQDNIGVLYGDGAGGLGDVTVYPTGGFPHAVDAGDIDGDGDLDLVSSNVDTADWTIYENQAGVFVNPRTLTGSTAASCAVLHDADNDGDLDMTGVDEIDDWIYFFSNEPSATPVRPTPAPAVTLFQNRPNPFNPSTAIRFSLTRASEVVLSVFDVEGGLVANLARRHYGPGEHEVRWNGKDARGATLPSGVYFYRLTAGGRTESKKMVLLK